MVDDAQKTHSKRKPQPVLFFNNLIKFFFSWTESSLLSGLLSIVVAGFSLQHLLLLQSTGSRTHGFQ